MKGRRRILVSGRGVVSPLGVGFDAHWRAIMEGRAAIGTVERLAALGLPASRGAAIAPELLAPHLDRLPRKQQKLYNRTTLLAMLAASLAMDDAALEPGAGRPDRFGVLLGANALWWDLEAMTGYLGASESAESPGTLAMPAANAFCMRSINPLDYSLKTLPNLAAGHVAIAQRAEGLCRVLLDGPIGSALAIGQGYRSVAESELDVALAGGADAQLETINYTASTGLGLVASDASGGPTYGEAAAFTVLEDADHAGRRGVAGRAELLGFASAGGDGRLTPAADAAAVADRLAAVLEDVLSETGRHPDVISLHGDGAEAHDAAEERALARVFGRRLEEIRRIRPKRAHGELGAAGTAVELLTCLGILEHGMTPPALTVNGAAGPPPRCAMVVALGIFGECAVLALGPP